MTLSRINPLLPSKDEVWRHQKGDEYTILSVDNDEATDNDVVIYYQSNTTGKTHLRSAYRNDGFMIPYRSDDGRLEPRFVMVRDSEGNYISTAYNYSRSHALDHFLKYYHALEYVLSMESGLHINSELSKHNYVSKVSRLVGKLDSVLYALGKPLMSGQHVFTVLYEQATLLYSVGEMTHFHNRLKTPLTDSDRLMIDVLLAEAETYKMA